jgi:hypothetical protein
VPTPIQDALSLTGDNFLSKSAKIPGMPAAMVMAVTLERSTTKGDPAA